MVQKTEAMAGISLVLRRLTETMAEAEKDAGLTYVRMAENIARTGREGIVREALGYIPSELETISAEDVFRVPKKRPGRKGREESARIVKYR